MKFDVKTIPFFDRKLKRLAKKYKSLKDDMRNLQLELASNPALGVDLGNGIRKVRMAITSKGKGKSGGARVITYTIEVDEENGVVTLLTIYDKSEQDSITQKEISEIIETLD